MAARLDSLNLNFMPPFSGVFRRNGWEAPLTRQPSRKFSQI
jgi:hypothetical protein